jgi:hypothetical protein
MTRACGLQREKQRRDTAMENMGVTDQVRVGWVEGMLG